MYTDERYNPCIIELLTKAGIMAIIRQVEHGEMTPKEAETRINARLCDLPDDEARAEYRRMMADVAMMVRS